MSETEAVRGYQFMSGDSCSDPATGDPFVINKRSRGEKLTTKEKGKAMYIAFDLGSS